MKQTNIQRKIVALWDGGLTEANRYVAEYLATVIEQGHLNTYLPAEKLASLLNGMLLGYAVIEFTSEFHELWEDRDDFWRI